MWYSSRLCCWSSLCHPQEGSYPFWGNPKAWLALFSLDLGPLGDVICRVERYVPLMIWPQKHKHQSRLQPADFAFQFPEQFIGEFSSGFTFLNDGFFEASTFVIEVILCLPKKLSICSSQAVQNVSPKLWHSMISVLFS